MILCYCESLCNSLVIDLAEFPGVNGVSVPLTTILSNSFVILKMVFWPVLCCWLFFKTSLHIHTEKHIFKFFGLTLKSAKLATSNLLMLSSNKKLPDSIVSKSVCYCET